jgi:hypothetical protein
MENLDKIPDIILFLVAFKIILNIALVLFFPWLIAYLYRKMNYIPWSVWEKNPNTKIWDLKRVCDSDFKRDLKIL